MDSPHVSVKALSKKHVYGDSTLRFYDKLHAPVIEILVLKNGILHMEIIWLIFYFTELRLPQAILQNKAGVSY